MYLCIAFSGQKKLFMKISEAKFAGSSTRVQQKPKRLLPEFAFIGRSNVGKSSLINMLCRNGRLAMTSSTPGKTKVVNHFLINDSWYLVDLPGYGFAKMGQKGREELVAVIRDYIHNSEQMVMLFVLIDSRHDIGAIDRDFIAELGENGIPFAIIFTKEYCEPVFRIQFCVSCCKKFGLLNGINFTQYCGFGFCYYFSAIIIKCYGLFDKLYYISH